MKRTKIILLIFLFATIAVMFSSFPFVQSKKEVVPPGTVAGVGGGNNKNPPTGYTGDWGFKQRCSNGAGDWVCKGKCEGPGEPRGPKEREPREKPVPRPTTTPAPNPPRTPTTTTSQLPNPSPNPKWVSVLGYTDSFNQCRDLCMQYQQSRCDSQLAIQYCRSAVSVDLDKNGVIGSSEIITTPSGTNNCEANARCYDVINTCVCGNSSLNMGLCISLFYKDYLKNGQTEQQALQNIAYDTAGNCNRAQPSV